MAETSILSEVHGSIWKIVVKVGDSVAADEPVAIVESMKMEIPVLAIESGIVVEIFVSEGQAVAEGAPIVSIRS